MRITRSITTLQWGRRRSRSAYRSGIGLWGWRRRGREWLRKLSGKGVKK